MKLSRQNVVPRAAAAPALGTRPAQSPSATTGKVRYVKRPKTNDELEVHLYDAPKEGPVTNMEHLEVTVPVHDLRQRQSPLTLDRNGFQLETLRVDDDIDWDNEEEVKSRYYPEVDKLLKRVSGATRTHIFDHTLRKGKLKSQEDMSSELEERNKPVSRVHVDYTLKSGVERLHMLLPDEAEKLQRTPFAVIQVWRPLKGPVDASPLGLLDVESLEESDYMSYTLHFPGRTGYNYAVAPDNHEKHRWYYAKGIDVDEAYVFKCYDSRRGRARFAPHTGFQDPHTADGAAPRESIEIRAYCFFENENEIPIAHTF